MNSEEYFKTYIYNKLNSAEFKTSKKYQQYICGHPKTINYVYYDDKDDWTPEDTIICIIHNGAVSISSTGKISNTTNRSSGFMFNAKRATAHWTNIYDNASNYTIDNTKILYASNCDKYTESLTCKNLLLDTDFYQSRRDEELKTLIESQNGSSSSEPVKIDMTSTNNILYTIALILCVILSLSVIRRLFNRGVR